MLQAVDMSQRSSSASPPDQSFLAITGAGVWLPGACNCEQLSSLLKCSTFPRQNETSPPTGASIEPRARRRASRLSRALADACAEATAQAGLDTSQIATVFGSTLGEAHTMISLLGQMWRREEMSPMGFATSVHSAASSVVSISAGNRAFTTSLSADYDTAGAALTEAWSVVQTMGIPAVVVCGDDHSPPDFVPESEAFDLLAIALSLTPLEPAPSAVNPVLGYLSLPHVGNPSLKPIDSSPQIARNPQAGLLDVLAHLLARRSGTVRLDRELGNGQVVTLVCQ